jgi:Ca2+/Na+ antiporter
VSSWGTAPLLVVFIAAGIATWIAGIYLSEATVVLGERFKLGDAAGTRLLVGLAGSLSELAITLVPQHLKPLTKRSTCCRNALAGALPRPRSHQ